MPSPLLPEITLPAPAPVPPIVLFDVPLSINTADAVAQLGTAGVGADEVALDHVAGSPDPVISMPIAVETDGVGPADCIV